MNFQQLIIYLCALFTLWSEALANQVYVHNISPLSFNNYSNIASELWTRKTPDVSHLRIFGEPTFAVNKKPTRKKLDSRCEEYIFVGYA
ncbi:hypothetical protein ROZALSC1DRAFT_17953, partial [Rozella allomycis CSF55]